MASHEGLFKDPDRYTKAHQALALWFVSERNVRGFLRYALGYLPRDILTEFEVTVTARDGFLYGFADVVLSFTGTARKREVILIELKSSFSDFGEVLRQIRTYRQFLLKGPVVRAYLIYPAPLEPAKEREVQSYFGSQGVTALPLTKVQQAICGGPAASRLNAAVSAVLAAVVVMGALVGLWLVFAKGLSRLGR